MPEQSITLFQADLQETLFPDDQFYLQSIVDGGVDINASKVEVPQQGGDSEVITNPTVFPIPVELRDDDVLEYDIDHLVTKPILVQNVNEAVLNYDKSGSVVKNQGRRLINQIANIAAFAWAATDDASIARTSGAAGSVNGPLGSTGNRLLLTKDDFIDLKTILVRSDADAQGFMCLIDAGLHGELLKIDEFVSLEKIGSANLAEGAIGRILGIDIFLRSVGQNYDNTSTPVPKPVGSSVAVADNLAIIAWNPGLVRRGQSAVRSLINAQDATFYGDVMSSEIRFGASVSRTDKAGVAALVQTAG